MFFRLSNKIEFNKELAKYLYKELKNENLDIKKENVLLYVYFNNNEHLLIDCLAGKVFHNKNNEEKYICRLSNFKNKTHLGEAYNCAIFNVKKIKDKINSLKNNELIKESSNEVLDLRKIKAFDLSLNDAFVNVYEYFFAYVSVSKAFILYEILYVVSGVPLILK